MKICLINNLYQPYAVGGAEKVVEARAKKYLAEGNEVFIITTQPYKGWDSLIPQKTIEEGIMVYRFYSPNIFWYKNLDKHNFLLKLIWHFLDIFNFWSTDIVYKILGEEKPDVVETHNLIGIGCYNFKFGHTHYLHDVQLVEPSGILPWNHKEDCWYQKIYSSLMKWRIGEPQVIISPSEFLQEFYRSRGFFEKSEWQVESLKVQSLKFKIISDKPKFLFVGSLVPHKGIRILMQAWDMVCHSREGENPETAKELHIVGDGILKTEVEDWAKQHQNIKVYGRLEGRDLEIVYEDSDILIFPSICLENCPTVILEAQKYGLKIIASDTGGVKELVGGESLVEPDNVEKLKNSIKNINKKSTD